jgi:hypothetical protein
MQDKTASGVTWGLANGPIMAVLGVSFKTIPFVYILIRHIVLQQRGGQEAAVVNHLGTGTQ